MPEMDGLEAVAAIRALDRPDAKFIPIIARTANAFDEDMQRSFHAGMNAHLSKPAENEHLFQVLGELIYEAEQREKPPPVHWAPRKTEGETHPPRQATMGTVAFGSR